MGYTSDVRVLLPEAEFNELHETLWATEYFRKYDVQCFRDEDAGMVKRYALPEREPLRFVYFGWNCIRWSNGDPFVRAVEDAVNESSHVHFMRIGEDHSDVEEYYMLEEAFVEGISVIRHFYDEF